MPQLITSIQKYSIHDGDGIRTTVFFKGCPLTCTWCHNPETQSYKKQVLYDEEKCIGCRTCEQACPEKAISVDDNGKVKTNKEICNHCGTCVDYCNLNLREVMGIEYTIKELVNQIKKDEIFYEESGGGVTLSGGEVMSANMDYMEALVKELDRQGISINIDTCGHVPYQNYQRLLPYVDTFLYDIKIMDNTIHEAHMGKKNDLILSNLKALSDDGAHICLRIPIIKEVNGEQKHMQEIIAYLKEENIQLAQVNLLPYHNTGSGKYNKLGVPYKGNALSTPSDEEMETFKQQFQQAGYHNTKIGG